MIQSDHLSTIVAGHTNAFERVTYSPSQKGHQELPGRHVVPNIKKMDHEMNEDVLIPSRNGDFTDGHVS